MPGGIKPGYYHDYLSYESGRNFVDIEFTAGVAGAVPAVNTAAFPHPGAGVVASIVKGGVGVYTINLNDAWVDLLVFRGWTIQAAYSAAGACHVMVTANNSGAATPSITVLVVNAAGAAVNPTTGDTIYFNFELQLFNAN